MAVAQSHGADAGEDRHRDKGLPLGLTVGRLSSASASTANDLGGWVQGLGLPLNRKRLTVAFTLLVPGCGGWRELQVQVPLHPPYHDFRGGPVLLDP